VAGTGAALAKPSGGDGACDRRRWSTAPGRLGGIALSIERANRLAMEADAFIYDTSFPDASYWKKLLRPGSIHSTRGE